MTERTRVGDTVTVTDDVTAGNAGFEQDIENTVVAASGADACVPEVARAPDNAPPPVHVFAFAEVQVSEADLLVNMLPTSDDSATVGAFQAVTETLLDADPPVPVHEIV